MTASTETFGLGSVVLERLLLQPVGVFELGAGWAIPSRAVREGLAGRVNTVGQLRRLFGSVIGAGDPGQTTLCTFVIGSLVPCSNELHELLAQPDGMLVDPALLRCLLAPPHVRFEFITHRVSGWKRGRATIDGATPDGRAAALRRTQAAAATGGRRALTAAYFAQYADVWHATRKAVYSDKVRQALLGARRLKIRSKHRRGSRPTWPRWRRASPAGARCRRSASPTPSRRRRCCARSRAP